MAVSSVSGASSIYGARSANIMSGLASGMDTEAMIEGMVQGLKSKIDRQKQDQQVLQWQQEAYRSISDKLVALSSKYTAFGSTSNLMSEAFFSPSIVTPQGANAGKLTASGSSNSNIQVQSVNKLAQTETISFTGLKDVSTVNNKTVSSTQGVDLNGMVDVSNIAGKQINLKFGNSSFSVTFSDKEYKSAQDVVDEFNEQLKNTSINFSNGSSVAASKVLKAENQDGKFAITLQEGYTGNALEVVSGSGDLLKGLHLEKGTKLEAGQSTLTGSAAIDVTTSKSTKDVLAGEAFNVTFNGTSATIRLPGKDSEEFKKIFDSAEPAKAMQEYLQTQFDRAFGYNRVKVGNAGEGSMFQPTFSVQDSDVFSITGGSATLIGRTGIFGIEQGASNRLNINQTLGSLYGDEFGDLKAVQENGQDKVDKNGNKLYALEINGVKIGEYTKDTNMATIMQDISRNAEAGVKVTYSTTSNQFVMSSTHGGAGGRIEIRNDNGDNLAAKLFGTVTYDDSNNITVERQSEANVTRGQDAEMTVSINGTVTKLTSGNNAFDVDGMTITANETFTDGGSVSFTSKVNTDTIINTIKDFVKDYNEVLAEVNSQYSTQPDKKGYRPLTEDQRKDMTEKQIEEYEKMAKQGLLYGDQDLAGLSSGLRFLFSNENMRKIGITTSSDYADKGKIVLDETKLRSMLESNPDAVKEAFAAPLQYTKDAEGNVTSHVDSTSSGVMEMLKVQLDKYAKTSGSTKGILIEKAGSKHSALSLLQNTLQKKYDSIDETIDKLTDQLNDRIDFYTSKFSKLEVLISQMNAQSSYLSGMGGGGY